MIDALQILHVNSATIAQRPIVGSEVNQQQESNSFLQVLEAMIASPGKIEEKNFHPEASLTSDLYALLNNLQEYLTKHSIALDESLLDTSLVERLFNEIPYELQREVEQLFGDQSTSLYELISDGETFLNTPSHIIVTMITLTNEQNKNESSEAPLLRGLEQRFIELLPVANYKDLTRATSNPIERLIISFQELTSKQREMVIHHLEEQKEKQEFTRANVQLMVEGHVNRNYPSNDEKSLQVNNRLPIQNKDFFSSKENSILRQEAFTSSSNKVENNATLTTRQMIEHTLTSTFKAVSKPETGQTLQGLNVPTTAEGLQMNKIQQFVIHVGEQRSGEQNNEQLIRQFQNILGRSSLAQFPNGLNQLTIKLFPEHLGRLDVKLMQQNGIITAKLMTTTNAARELVESQLQQLRQAFATQNIQVEKIEVTTQQQQQQLLQDRQNEEQKGKEQQQQQNQRQKKEDESRTFEEFLEEVEFNEEV